MPEILIDYDALAKAGPKTKEAVNYITQGLNLDQISYIINIDKAKLKKMLLKVMKRKVQVRGFDSPPKQ